MNSVITRGAHSWRQTSLVFSAHEEKRAPGPDRRQTASSVQKFKYNKISLSGSIEDRMAVTNISMVAYPGTAREEQLEINIPEGAFVDFLEIRVGNAVMRGTVKGADIAAAAYGNAVKNSQTAALALSRGNSVLSLKVSITADDRTIVTVGYSHFLASRSGQYEYPFPLILWDNKATGGQSALPTLIADFLIVDADGLKSVSIPKLEIKDPSFLCDWSTTCGKGGGVAYPKSTAIVLKSPLDRNPRSWEKICKHRSTVRYCWT